MNRRMYRLYVQPFSDRIIINDTKRDITTEGEDITAALLNHIEAVNGKSAERVVEEYRSSGGVTYE